MQMIRSGDNRKTQLLSQLDQKNFFSALSVGSAAIVHAVLDRREKVTLQVGKPVKRVVGMLPYA